MKSVKLLFASDLAPIRGFADVMKSDPEAVYGDLLPVIRSAGYSIVNLESPLYTAERFITKSGAAFAGDPEHIQSLVTCGFNAVICANNHTFDSGIEGFERTKKLLGDHGIAVVGAGDDLDSARRELVIETEGIRIGLFTISEGEDMMGAKENAPGVSPWEPDLLARRIRKARDQYDVILVSAHCGLEYQPYPSFYVYEAFKSWAEAGADMIIGHHPHVPQGMALFGKTPAYFSLGNFVFYQPVDLLYRKTGYMVEMEIGKSGILSHRTIPYRIGKEKLHLLAGEDLAAFETLFAQLSAPLASQERALQAWNAVLAYNGIDGFRCELEKILQTMRETPAKGAAMLRNRVTCIQHSSQWIDGMSRIMDGTISEAPQEMIDMVREFLTRRID